MKSNLEPDITPDSHPDHHTVGRDFMGYSNKNKKVARYYCRSHDASGYNMVNRSDPTDDINISERAINRTFWEIYEFGNVERSQWGIVRISKDGVETPKPELIAA